MKRSVSRFVLLVIYSTATTLGLLDRSQSVDKPFVVDVDEVNQFVSE